jgi:TonB family protein
MNAQALFTEYLLPIAIGLMVLWVAYRLLFTNSNRFQFNRFYLLSAMLFSLALPLFGLLMGQSTPQVVAFKHHLLGAFMLNEITISYGDPTAVTLPEVEVASPTRIDVSLWQVLCIIYLIGVAVSALLFLFKMGKLVVMIIRSPKRRMDGYTMVFTHKEHGPYSFFRYAFFTDEKVNPDIIRHELSHISHHHSWDILMVELMKIFQWFNPFIYFYKRELQSLHEYIADDDVVANGVDKRNYMMLILQQCTAVDFSDMSNNFSLILTKKRIKMITKHEKAKGFWWKLLATLPVLALLLIVNARASAQQVKKTDETVYEISTKDITNVKIKKVDNDSIYQIVEVMPEFPGGTEKMMDYLSKNIKYPEAAKEKGISGRAFLSFVIEKDGAVSDVKVVKGIGKECDDEALRVVKAMPKWKPGLMKGKPVRVSYMLPIFFKLDEGEAYKPVKGETIAPQADVKPDKNGIWDIAETMPEYPGGIDGLKTFIQENLTVPEKYKEMDAKAEYRVFVQFVVAEDGSITNVELKKSEPSKKDLNEEAVRVVKSMPKWKPGTVDGKPVKVRYMLPVLFKLGK